MLWYHRSIFNLVACHVILMLDLLKRGRLNCLQLQFEVIFTLSLQPIQLSHCMSVREPKRKQWKKHEKRACNYLLMELTLSLKSLKFHSFREDAIIVSKKPCVEWFIVDWLRRSYVKISVQFAVEINEFHVSASFIYIHHLRVRFRPTYPPAPSWPDSFNG